MSEMGSRRDTEINGLACFIFSVNLFNLERDREREMKKEREKKYKKDNKKCTKNDH